MAGNYPLLPENTQRRPLPGHCHRPKKDKKGPEAFTPFSRAGRRAPGEAKVKTPKETNGADLFRFIRKLNNFSAGRPTFPDGEPTKVKAAPALTVTNEQGVSGYLPQKRPMADNAKSSVEVVDTRPVKDSRSNVIASSSRAKPEDLQRPPNPVSDTVNPVGTAESDHTYGNAEQQREREHFHPHEFLPNLNPTQSHAVITQHAVHGINPPVFPGHIVSHQPANQFFHVHEAPNPLASVFPQYNSFEMRNTDNLELESVAITYAYGRIGEPMDIDPEFPTFIPNDSYVDLTLNRVAAAYAYVAVEEPMDTVLDDTQGPMIHFVPQEPHVFDPPGFAQYVPPQDARFEPDIMLQPPMYQTIEPLQYQRFVDQEQRLQPPIHVNHQLHQGNLVTNQIFPVQANQFPVMEGYFPLAPRFDIGYPIHQYLNVPIRQRPLIHDEPINRQFIFYPPAHEELINGLHIPPFVNEMVGHGERIPYQVMGEARELAHPGNRRFFMNPEVGELFELFGIGDEDEDDNGDDDGDDNDYDDE